MKILSSPINNYDKESEPTEGIFDNKFILLFQMNQNIISFFPEQRTS